jgi:hypothetical protein
MTVATMLDGLTCGVPWCPCAAAARNGAGRVHCPAHNDERPSLNVSDRDGTTLVHCHAGCAQDAVIAALRDRKLWNGTGPASTARTIEATYPYTDEHGAPLFEVVRYRPKGFVQRRPDGHGGWLYHLNGTRRVVFNLPEVRAVAEAGWQVFVAEGEKDAVSVIGLGLCATTSPHGAGKWRDDYAESLRGAELVVIADKDEPGRAHAQSVARSCFGKAKSVKVLELPGGAVKDASDWISAGGTRAELEALAAAAPEWTPADREIHSAALGMGSAAERIPLRFLSVDELAARTPRTADFLLEGYLPRGGVVEVVGKVKAAGKTTLVLAWCRAVLNGEAFAGRATKRAGVVYLTEQADASFREALQRAGLDDEVSGLSVLPWHDAIGFKWPEVVAAAVDECKKREAHLLVVDTIAQWAGIRGDSENNAGDALEAVLPLQEAASLHRLCVVVVRHARKGGGEVGDDGRGSSAFAGAVDIVLSLRRPENSTDGTVRVLHALSRFGATPETLALQLTPTGYRPLGDEASFAFEVAKRAVLDIAPRTEEHAMQSDDLLDAAKVRRTSGQEAIATLVELAQLVKIGKGKKGDPFRYYQPEIHSAADLTPRAAERIEPPAEGRSEAGTSIAEGSSLSGTRNGGEA